MVEAKKKGRGRPPKPAQQRKRNNVTIRMRDALKSSIEHAASAHQRSLSEEIEARLERSLAEEDLFGSPEIHRWAMLLAAEFLGTGEYAFRRDGGDASAGNVAWMKDWHCFLEATLSVMLALAVDLERHPRANLDHVNEFHDALERVVNRIYSPQQSGFLKPKKGHT